MSITDKNNNNNEGILFFKKVSMSLTNQKNIDFNVLIDKKKNNF